MQDRYLFRGKRIDNVEWVIGGLIRYGFAAKEKYYIVPTYASDLYAFEVDPSTICQCTGAKDKNGKLIWENDIMQAHLDDDFPDDVTVVKILWHENGWCTNQYVYDNYEELDEFDSEHFEAVGNIIDNPELWEMQE